MDQESGRRAEFRRSAFVAAALIAAVHAGMSLYWACGGTWLLGTLGHDLTVAFAGQRGWLVPVAAVKALAGVGPLWADGLAWPARRATRGLTWTAAALLIAWGGANTVVGNLVLTGVIRPDGGYDRAAMMGHAWLWDPLFLGWGVALVIGLRLAPGLSHSSRCARSGAKAGRHTATYSAPSSAVE